MTVHQLLRATSQITICQKESDIINIIYLNFDKFVWIDLFFCKLISNIFDLIFASKFQSLGKNLI